MPSDAFDGGLLSPVTVGHDSLVGDRAVLDALVGVEVALAQAYGDVGVAPEGEVGSLIAELTQAQSSEAIDPRALALAAVAGGNPVIALTAVLKERVPESARLWIHRGATSQDIVDSALMVVSSRAVAQVRESLLEATERLLQLADTHRDTVVAARTLTQHAVPTTVGLRAVGWARGIRRAADRLDAIEMPAQLGGAGGTLASFVEITGSPEVARDLVVAFARRLGMSAPAAPWHVTRWPVTELGDALVQAVDALGKFAADVTTLTRTEIAEITLGARGGSSAMPQKQNPTEAVLVRSAAIRAPHLGATLHSASALAVDERPDGAWHAEWPALRELLRLALGASAHAASLAANIRVDAEIGARNLAAGGGLVVAERLSLDVTPVLGPDAVATIIAQVGAGADLADAVRRVVAQTDAAGIDVDALVEPANYTGLARSLVDDAVRELRTGAEEPS